MRNKSIKEKIIAIFSAGISSFTPFMLIGCQPKEQDPNKDTPVNPNQQQQTENQALQQEVSAYDKLVVNMKKGNFIYKETVEGKTTESLFDGNSMKVGDRYYVSQDGKDYVVSQKDGKWQKDLSEISVSGELNAAVSKFENIDFTAFNNSTLEGKDAKGNKVTAKKTANSITLTVGNSTYAAEDIGSTNLSVPNVEVDNTIDPEVLKNQLIENVEKYFEKLAKDKNFTYQLTNNGQTTTYNFANNVAMVENEDGIVYYETATQNNETKKFEYAMENGEFHKKECETDLNKLVSDATNLLNGVTWKNYNKQDGTLEGVVNGKLFTLSLADGNLSINLENGTKVEISNVNSTAVKLPQDFVDESNLENLLWIKDANGEVKYNLVAMKEVLEKWLKGDNQFGKDYAAVWHLRDNCATGPIVYINIAEDGVHVGNIRILNNNRKFFFDGIITGLLDKFKDGSVQTKEQLKNYMFSLDERAISNYHLTPSGIELEYSTLDEDYEKEHKVEFEKLTENLFDRLKNIGIQTTDINKQDEKTREDNDGVKILFGFRTKLDDSGLALYMGMTREWNQYYIMEKNGNIELVKYRLIGANNVNEKPLDFVLRNKPEETKKWAVVGKEKKCEISNDNLSLLNPIMTINTKTKEL